MLLGYNENRCLAFGDVRILRIVGCRAPSGLTMKILRVFTTCLMVLMLHDFGALKTLRYVQISLFLVSSKHVFLFKFCMFLPCSYSVFVITGATDERLDPLHGFSLVCPPHCSLGGGAAGTYVASDRNLGYARCVCASSATTAEA